MDECRGYEISRTPALAFYEFVGFGPNNCCLELRTFDEADELGLVVDSQNDETNCGKDSICWAYYEKAQQDEQCDPIDSETRNELDGT